MPTNYQQDEYKMNSGTAQPVRASNTDKVFKQLYKSGAPATVDQYKPTAVNGTTWDLSGLYGAIGTKPTTNSNLSTDSLVNKMNAPQTNGTTTDLSSLKTANGQRPADTFSLGQLNDSINSAKTAGGTVEVQSAKYQDPAQYQALISQMNSVLAPLTQAQQAAAQKSYGQQSSALADKWAANGLLASGGAMAQQQQGANDLATQMSNIEATQQANALGQAMNFANLSLTEDNQKFNQNANNRDFAASQAQNNVGNIAAGLGQQNGMQQNWMNNATNIANMDIGQSQWSQQYGQQAKQNDINNQLNAMNFQQGLQQDYINNLQNANQMDMSQNQWSQQFGQAGQQQQFGQWMDTQNLNRGLQQDYMSNLLAASGQTENARQYDQSQATNQNQFAANNQLDWSKLNQNQNQFNSSQQQQQNQFTAQQGQNQNQFNVSSGLQQQQQDLANKTANGEMAAKLSQLFGTSVNPTTDWGNMFSQVAGQQTSASQTNTLNALMDLMKTTPNIQNNLGNVTSGMSNYGGLTDILNQMGGQQTQQTWNKQQDMNMAKDNNAISWANHNTSAANSGMDNLYKQWQMDKGNASDASSKNTESMLSELLSQPDRSAAEKLISEHHEDISKLGIKVSDLQKGLDQKFGSVKLPTTSNMTQREYNDAVNEATKAAQADTIRWAQAKTQEQRDALIAENLKRYNISK